MSATHYVELYKDDAGEWRWRRIKSSDIVANSADGYLSRHYCHQVAEAEALAHDCDLIITTDHTGDDPS